MDQLNTSARRFVEELMDGMVSQAPDCLRPDKHSNEETGDVKWSYFPHGLYSFFGAVYNYEGAPYLWLSIGLTNLNGTNKAAILEEALKKNELISAPFRFGLEDDVLTVGLRIPITQFPPAYLQQLVFTAADFAHYAFGQMQETFPNLKPLAQQVSGEREMLN